MTALKLLVVGTTEFFQEVKTNSALVCVHAETPQDIESIIAEGLSENFPSIVCVQWEYVVARDFSLIKKIRSYDLGGVQIKILMATPGIGTQQIGACIRFRISKCIVAPLSPENLLSALDELSGVPMKRGLQRAV